MLGYTDRCRSANATVRRAGGGDDHRGAAADLRRSESAIAGNFPRSRKPRDCGIRGSGETSAELLSLLRDDRSVVGGNCDMGTRIARRCWGYTDRCRSANATVRRAGGGDDHRGAAADLGRGESAIARNRPCGCGPRDRGIRSSADTSAKLLSLLRDDRRGAGGNCNAGTWIALRTFWNDDNSRRDGGVIGPCGIGDRQREDVVACRQGDARYRTGLRI